jgi:hypothetical protein
MKIKTCILVDPMGTSMHTAEEEVETHKKVFAALIFPCELDAYRAHSVGGIQEGTDLVIYDFGGMLPGTSLMEDNSRYLIKWAENNPNSLILVVSDYTYRVYVKYEIDELFEKGGIELHNIILEDHNKDHSFPQWWLDDHGIVISGDNLDKAFDASIDSPTEDLVEEKYVPKKTVKKKKIAKKKKEPKEIKNDPDPVVKKPRVPVATISVPVQRDWYPGQTKGTMRFKLADCMVDVIENENTPKEKQVAHFGGTFFGFYEISFPDGNGDLWSYSIHPEDFYAAFKTMHEQLLKEG